MFFFDFLPHFFLLICLSFLKFLIERNIKQNNLDIITYRTIGINEFKATHTYTMKDSHFTLTIGIDTYTINSTLANINSTPDSPSSTHIPNHKAFYTHSNPKHNAKPEPRISGKSISRTSLQYPLASPPPLPSPPTLQPQSSRTRCRPRLPRTPPTPPAPAPNSDCTPPIPYKNPCKSPLRNPLTPPLTGTHCTGHATHLQPLKLQFPKARLFHEISNAHYTKLDFSKWVGLGFVIAIRCCEAREEEGFVRLKDQRVQMGTAGTRLVVCN